MHTASRCSLVLVRSSQPPCRKAPIAGCLLQVSWQERQCLRALTHRQLHLWLIWSIERVNAIRLPTSNELFICELRLVELLVRERLDLVLDLPIGHEVRE